MRHMNWLFLVLAGLMIVARPAYGDLGLAMFHFAPVLLGIAACGMRSGIPGQALFVFASVAFLGSANVVFLGISEGSFYFDGDANLVWIGVVVQVVNATIALGIAWAVRLFAAGRNERLARSE